MLYIPKTDDYLKILTDKEVKYFVDISFNEYFKSTKNKMYQTLYKEQNLRKVAKSLQIFLTTPGEVEKYVLSNSSDNCIGPSNIEILIRFDPTDEH